MAALSQDDYIKTMLLQQSSQSNILLIEEEISFLRKKLLQIVAKILKIKNIYFLIKMPDCIKMPCERSKSRQLKVSGTIRSVLHNLLGYYGIFTRTLKHKEVSYMEKHKKITNLTQNDTLNNNIESDHTSILDIIEYDTYLCPCGACTQTYTKHQTKSQCGTFLMVIKNDDSDREICAEKVRNHIHMYTYLNDNWIIISIKPICIFGRNG